MNKNLFFSHADKPDESSRFTNPGYLCPQCLSKHCELPVECRACGLTLVSAPHLARSYHYLFPIKHFVEKQYEGQPSNCYACQRIFTENDKKVFFLVYYLIQHFMTNYLYLNLILLFFMSYRYTFVKNVIERFV